MPNICILGNCQARSLSLSSIFSKYPVKYYLSSILEWDAHSNLQEIKVHLRRNISEGTLKALLQSGHMRINAPLRDILAARADHFVFTLFHEIPYFLHKTKGYGLTVSLEGLEENNISLDLSRLLADEFTCVHPDEKTYYDRFYDYLTSLKRFYPQATLIIVSRLKTRLFDKPTKAWIANWEALQSEMDGFLQRCQSDFDAHIVDMSPIAESLLAKGYEPGDIAPLDIDISYHADAIHISTVYDIEHLHAPFWNLIADRVLQETGFRPATEPDIYREFAPEDGRASKAARALSHCIRHGDPTPFVELMRSATDHESRFAMLTAVEAASFLSSRYALRDEIGRFLLCFPDGDDTLDYVQVRARIDRIRNHLNGKRPANMFHSKNDMVLWGAGGRCRIFLGLLNEKELRSIKCIVDSNMALHKTTLHGIPVFHPSRFGESGMEKMNEIIVMSHYFEEIVSEAQRLDLFSNVRFLRSDEIFHNVLKQSQICVSIS